MKEEVIIITLIIQFIIQLALYLGTNKFIHCLIRLITKTLSTSHKVFDMKRQAMADGITGLQLLTYNIILSMVVLKFTSTSTLAGITNLGASVFVGCVMAFQYSKFGKYHIKVEEECFIVKQSKKCVNKIKQAIEKATGGK